MVVDEDGKGVGGATFSFFVTSGGGTITTGTGTVGADGTATPGTWTLGKTAGANILNATVDGIGSPQTFTATGIAGAAASGNADAGNNQTAATGSAVSVAPAVKVVDA